MTVHNAKKIVVEDWLYDPKQYEASKGKKIVEFKNKLYLNSYEPNDLTPEMRIQYHRSFGAP